MQNTLVYKKPKLVIAINTAEQFLTHRVHLANEATANGYEVIVLCPESKNISKILDLGFQVNIIKLNRKSYNPFSEIFYFYSIYKNIKKISPEIYHGFTIKMVIYGTIASRMLNVPNIVNTITGLGYVFIDKGLVAKTLKTIIGVMYARAFKSSKIHVSFQNRDDHNFFVKQKWVTKEQSSIILGTGVDLQKYSYTEEPNDKIFKILFPARLLKDKGLSELVNAVDLLSSELNNIKLIICGRMDLGNPNFVSEAELNSILQKKCIEYKGEILDMYLEYRQCHAVCLPSYGEGIPLALIEAASSGRAIVTTDVPGCREVVENEVNGLLVKERSDVAVYDGLKKIIQNKEVRINMAKKGRIKAEKYFDRKIVLSQYLSLYKKEKIKKAA
jgi:glycosyltransferase involved in cell wall biosynthesis